MDLQELVRAFGTIANLFKALNAATALELKRLLETKHLYQRVSIDAQRIICEVRDRVYPQQIGTAVPEGPMESLYRQPCTPTEEDANSIAAGSPLLILKHVKIFCSNCEDREAFRPVWFTEVATSLANTPKKVSPDSLAGFQLFVLIYQCQHCLGTPIGFLVRRQRWHLILEGRSPMEEVEVPPYIPRAESRFFRDAIIAIQAGKTLAALFYLRTFIEQFAKRQTGTTERMTGDELMAAYRDTLPKAHRDHMPSLGDWYAQLSGALHEAREDTELFQKAVGEIGQHFDVRRVFKIPDAGTAM